MGISLIWHQPTNVRVANLESIEVQGEALRDNWRLRIWRFYDWFAVNGRKKSPRDGVFFAYLLIPSLEGAIVGMLQAIVIGPLFPAPWLLVAEWKCRIRCPNRVLLARFWGACWFGL